MAMDERFFLEKAQEAEALADAAFSEMLRYQWEFLASEYRRLARDVANMKRQDGVGPAHQDADRDLRSPARF